MLNLGGTEKLDIALRFIELLSETTPITLNPVPSSTQSSNPNNFICQRVLFDLKKEFDLGSKQQCLFYQSSCSKEVNNI
ncbi:hypothetical protein NPIL_187591 [Nephila pilipes]|uniref:Uncharacterized protein n=1 Tax=Nephila pilipes TaxID=299642 RepID=A0A8X6NDT3_NEPPI|nr:hypothetical protein NPIL_187591 [Nephila pilipes]